MKKLTKKLTNKYRHRSAVTGRFVKKSQAEKRKRTTVRERLK